VAAAARPDLYTDHNVSLRLAERLRGRRYTVTTTRDLGLERAKDSRQLLIASDEGWLLLTHSERDFALLFDAWRRWSEAWGVSPRHAGIVVRPQREPPVAEAVFLALLNDHPDLADSLWRWQPSIGCARLPYVQ
jgi:hypothetical protein